MSSSALPEAIQRRYLIGLGSNIQPEVYLPRAVQLLHQLLTVQAVSTAWETPAVGIKAPDFLNAAMLVLADCPPERMKYQFLRRVEAHLGRVRTADRNAPRTIDLDILLMDEACSEPLLWEQAYLAVPAAELLPDLICPETGERLEDTARRLAAHTSIQARPEVLQPWAKPIA